MLLVLAIPRKKESQPTHLGWRNIGKKKSGSDEFYKQKNDETY